MEIMGDIETLGTSPNSVIVSIGAAMFDLTKGEIVDKFYRVIDIQSCVDAGLVIDPGTVVWWMKQSDAARKVFTEQSFVLPHVLKEFSAWVGKSDSKCRFWGNGATFDNVLVDSAYKAVGLRKPWGYWDDRCYRTVAAMVPHVKIERSGTHHNALDDAITQAKHLIKIWPMIGGFKNDAAAS